MPNDEERLLTDLSSKGRKKCLGPKINFPKFAFWTVKIFLLKKSYQYSNSNSPLFGPIVKKHIGSFHDDIANLARYKKCNFFILDPKID